MQTNRPVVVAVDLSEQAVLALQQGDALARQQGVPLYVVHALPELYSVHPLFPQLNIQEAFAFSEFEPKAAAAVQAYVEQAISRAPEDYQILLASGSPHHVIVEQAQHVQAGTIVVGASGHGVASVLGRTVRRVVRHAPCDVLVVRPGADGMVMTGTDFSEHAKLAVTRAAREAQRLSKPLGVVYSLDFIPPGVALPGVDVPMPSLSALDNVRAEMKRMLADEAAGVGAEGILKEGPAAHGLVEVARERGASLIVVGTHGRTGLGRLALGSVAETVVESSPCSVLVVRASVA